MLKKFREGVVYPIPPAFKKDQSLNIDAVCDYLYFLKVNNCKTIMTTAGTSKYNLLDDDEIKLLNTVVGNSELTSIIGLPAKSTTNLQPLLKHAESTDADAIMLLYPDRYYCDEDIIEFFFDVADRSTKPIFFHGMFMRNAKGGQYEYSPELCAKLKAHKNIVGMKEESINLNTGYGISKVADPFFIVVPAGGSCRRFNYCYPAGAQTFLGGIGNVWPQIENKYFEAVKSKDIDLANRIVTELEDPFMACAKQLGWHKFLRVILNKKELLKSEIRKPFSVPRTQEVQSVLACIENIETKLAESFEGII
jgi:dihydrodipicolinate synthase/N-acetylneuraminate lyase